MAYCKWFRAFGLWAMGYGLGLRFYDL